MYLFRSGEHHLKEQIMKFNFANQMKLWKIIFETAKTVINHLNLLL